MRGVYAVKALAIVREAANKWTIAWAITLILQGVIPAGIVWTTKWLIDAVAGAVAAGTSWEVLARVLVPVAGLGEGMGLQQSPGSIRERDKTATDERGQGHLNKV